jgi:hypothetical protein
MHCNSRNAAACSSGECLVGTSSDVASGPPFTYHETSPQQIFETKEEAVGGVEDEDFDDFEEYRKGCGRPP